MADAPIPLSFPSVLQKPGLVDRLREMSLNDGMPMSQAIQQVATKKHRRGDNPGKRWTRRKENAGLVGNPHTVPATQSDYLIPQPHLRPTFPEPLPAYLPRNVKAPSAMAQTQDPASANAGRFTMSFKGMRRELRKSGYRTQVLVQEVEDEIVRWLEEGGIILDPNDTTDDANIDHDGPYIGQLEAIRQVGRSPVKLVWRVENSEDAFARYVIHCCARYYEVVSYSKDVAGRRLTYLLRPNVTRPDYWTRAQAKASLETPPTTDLDYSSPLDTSDFSASVSDISSASEGEDADVTATRLPSLSDIEETGSVANSDIDETMEAGKAASRQDFVGDEWSIVEVESDRDAEGGDEGGLSEPELASSTGAVVDVDTISLGESGVDRSNLYEDGNSTAVMLSGDAIVTPSRITRRDHYGRVRSTSSPSRSPAPRMRRRRAAYHRRKMHLVPSSRPSDDKSFYEFLFG